MKANELRIGNYITGIYEDNNDEERKVLCRVIALDETGDMIDYKIWVETFGQDSAEYFSEFEPITLTEEWLLWLGFTVKVKNYSLNIGSELFEYAIKDQFVIWNAKDSLELRIKKQGPGWVFREMTEKNDLVYKYVHQLQNLYFALTGEELILNK